MGRSLQELVAEWRVGPLPGELPRASLDRLSAVRAEIFGRLGTPASIKAWGKSS